MDLVTLMKLLQMGPVLLGSVVQLIETLHANQPATAGLHQVAAQINSITATLRPVQPHA